MWLNQLFVETPIDFEKRCKNRIILGSLIAVLGAVTFVLAFILDLVPAFVLYREPEWSNFVPGFYTGIGGGFLGAGLVTVVKNYRYLKNPELNRKQKIYETDERNRMLGLRSWAYAGYSMFLFLYIGVVVSGFISVTAMKVFLTVGGVYAVLLLFFRKILQKAM